MPEPQQLAQLRDIHSPDPIGWWPLAPGWYILAVFLAILVVTCIFYGYRYYFYGRAKRQALALLEGYSQDHLHNGNSAEISAKVSELLRRVALVYFPREDVASLYGEAWLSFLNNTSVGINFNAVKDYLLELPYHSGKNVDLAPLFTRARAWIKQRGIPCSS